MTDVKDKKSESASPAPVGVRDESLIPGDPYALMSEFGVGYATTAKELHLAGIEAQAIGRLDRARSKAWTDLRNVERRLALDFTFAEVPQTETLPNSALPLEFGPLPPPSVEALADALLAPTVAIPPTASQELPLPTLNVWQLAGELFAEEKPPAFNVPDPKPFIQAPEENPK